MNTGGMLESIRHFALPDSFATLALFYAGISSTASACRRESSNPLLRLQQESDLHKLMPSYRNLHVRANKQIRHRVSQTTLIVRLPPLHYFESLLFLPQ